MINSKKKGFTIVELVIVIAVIAVLAAVLIPTFSNLVKKANMSADQQAVRQMNTSLAMAGNPGDIETAINALADAGYNSKDALIPVSTGYCFYWYESAKIVVLVKDNTVVFPEGIAYEEGVLLESSIHFIDVVTSDSRDLFKAFENGNHEITLSDNVFIDYNTKLTVSSEDTISLDLNGKEISGGLEGGHDDKHVNVITVNGKVTIKNGVINTRNIIVNTGGELILENSTINALDLDGGACIYAYEGSKVSIKNCALNSNSFTYAIVSQCDELIIENTSIIADRGCISVSKGTTTINSGIFEVTGNRTDTAHVLYVSEGNAIINGGTFTNKGTGQDICIVGSGSVEDNR